MTHWDDPAEENISMPARVAAHMDTIAPALAALSAAFSQILNGQESPEAIVPAIRGWFAVRQSINNSENIGIALSLSGFAIVGFELSGDLKQDIGQVNQSKGS